jgi:hypothetical protein
MDIKTKFKVGDSVFFLTENDQVYSPKIGKIHLLSGRVHNFNVFCSSSSHFAIEYSVEYPMIGGSKTVKIEEEFLSDNIGELINKIIDQAPKNIRVKINRKKI